VPGYIPKWQSLAAALAMVMTPGQDRRQSQVAICSAVADRAVAVRVTISDAAASVFEGPRVYVPAHLHPEDLDWERSYPKAPWLIKPTVSQEYLDDWWRRPQPIAFLELSTDDLTRVLLVGRLDDPPSALHRPGVSEPTGRNAPAPRHARRRHIGKLQKLAAAFLALHQAADNIRSPASVKDLHRRAVKKAGVDASDRTLERARTQALRLIPDC
jgi:hypothetical protein